jgi:excisionase family DNA binding protein
VSGDREPSALLLEELARRIAQLVLEGLLAQLAAEAPATTPARYLTTSEAAALCHVSTRTIRNWVRDGRLARYGGAGRPLYRPDELIELLEQRGSSPQRTPPPSQPARRARRRT